MDKNKVGISSIITASDLHPYACITEKCPHCLRVVNKQHNPKTCCLCNWEQVGTKKEIEGGGDD